MKPNPALDRLLIVLLAELGAGRIWEGFLPSTKDAHIDAETEGQKITINPAPEIVDSVLHECAHRAFPAWKESYVKGRISALMKRITDEQVQAIYAEYVRRKRTRRRPKKAEEG